MTAVGVPATRRGPFAVAVALVIAAALVLLSVMVIVPPYTMAMVPIVVGSTELSPLLVLLDLVWCLAANRLLRGHAWLRGATIAALVVAAMIAVRPLTQFTAIAASSSAQLGTEASQPRYSLLTAMVGLPSSKEVVARAIAYHAADGAPLTMRLYALPADTARPTVVVIYGGAWRGGDATQCEDVSRALASRGYMVAAIDYRHAPTFHHPAQLDDVRASFRLLRDSAQAWKVDVTRVAVLGRSAGGQLAELTAFAPGGFPVRAVIAIYAPHDLVEGYRNLPSPDPIDGPAVLRAFIGGTPDNALERFRAASPSSYVRPGLPPTLLLYGGKDHVVKPEFNRGAAAALRAARVPVVAVELPWAEHGFDMAPAGLGAQLALSVISEFLKREIGKH